LIRSAYTNSYARGGIKRIRFQLNRNYGNCCLK